MRKKLIKSGKTSKAIIIPSTILKLMGIDPNQENIELNMEFDGKNIIISKIDDNEDKNNTL